MNNPGCALVAACEAEKSLLEVAVGDRQANHKLEFPFPVGGIG